MVIPPHFLLIPLPEHGHITPMLSLASHLAALGCSVTFLSAEKAPLIAATVHPAEDASVGNGVGNGKQQSVGNGASHNTPFATNLHFRTLPYTGGPSLLSERSSRFDILKETLAGLEARQEMVEMMVQESKSSVAPMLCIICDILLCSWVMPLAKREAILSTVLVPCSLTNFYVLYLKKIGKSEEAQRLSLSVGLPAENKATPMVNEEQKKRFEEVRSVFFGAQDNIEQSSYALVNSCKCLETEVLDMLGVAELNFKFIGPCFPAWETDDAGRLPGMGMAMRAGCLFSEDDSCLSWLDRLEKKSVLLVSFGSEVTPDAEQVQELAMGIEASGCNFLWVVRPDSHKPPKDFLERTCNVGLCVSWAPQRRVLQHSAVGGFLTHCGWNSTLESMLFGVPMLCLPLNGDQFLNAHIIHTHWKVGLRLGPPNTLAPRAEVERCVRELLSSEDLRWRISPLQEQVHEAWLECPSTISSFVQEVGVAGSVQHD